MNLFYKPKHASVGDVIPFYDDGLFKPFYLKGYRDYYGTDASGGWNMLTTRDHLRFEEHATGIRGGTGSVVKVDGLYHLFYCTFEKELKRQYAKHAISKDLDQWQTLEEDTFGPDGTIYELTDWRDPHVFWNEEANEWWMLIAAKHTGKTSRRGCIGFCTSKDMHRWAIREPFYAPHMHTSAHECPDIFKMGDWYYLIYSQYTDRFQTYYRMSKSLDGPWLTPEVDSFDTRCFYAAKTGSDGKDRYLYAWNPTRYYNMWGFNPVNYAGKDYNSFDWGGTMIVHKLIQNSDGTLRVTVPETVDNALSVPNEIPMEPMVGNWKTGADFAIVETPGGYGTLMLQNRVPELCKLEMDITFTDTAQEIGVALQVDEEFDKGYYLSIQPYRNRIEFKSYLRMFEEGGWTFPFDVEMERPIRLEAGKAYKLRVFVQDSILLAYLDNETGGSDSVAINTRMFDYQHRYFGLFASDGGAKFENIKLWT